MTNKQIIETIRDICGDLIREENERAEKNIAFNPTHAKERRAMQSAYNDAILQVMQKCTELNKRIRTEE